MNPIKETNYKLVDYKRVVFEVDHDKSKTPTNQEILDKISKNLKVDHELIKLKHIYTKYGSTKSKIIAHVYGNVENLKRIEEIKKKPKVKKEKKQQAKKE